MQMMQNPPYPFYVWKNMNESKRKILKSYPLYGSVTVNSPLLVVVTLNWCIHSFHYYLYHKNIYLNTQYVTGILLYARDLVVKKKKAE